MVQATVARVQPSTKLAVVRRRVGPRRRAGALANTEALGYRGVVRIRTIQGVLVGVVACLVGCQFERPRDVEIDAQEIDAPLIECTASTATCSNDRYTECDASGRYVRYEVPNGGGVGVPATLVMHDFACPLGCSDATRCANPVPSHGLAATLPTWAGGGVDVDLTTSNGSVISLDTDASGAEVELADAVGNTFRVPVEVITQAGGPEILVLKVRTLTIRGPARVVATGARALAVAAAFDIVIEGRLDASAPQQTLSEVAAHTGLTRAGARRILLTLQTLGYVESDGKLFRLTPRILDLGFAYLSSLPLWNLAEPLMEDLVEEVRESSSAAVLDGLDIVYVLRVPTHKIMRTSLGVGSRLPAAWTSMGRVLLASLPDDELQSRLATLPLQRHTAHTATDLPTLLERIRQARTQGWCLVNQELEEGLISIAAPLTNRLGQTVAALNISGQANRTSAELMQQTLLPPLLRAAQTISRLMGAPRR